MLEVRGHAKKRLVQLTVEGAADVPGGAEITLPEGGASIGNVTSRAPSPKGDATIALGYVKWKHATAGAALSVEGRPATITKAPPSKDEGAAKPS
jgi:glycine cleavage system aminomethyltransferase T